MNTIRRAVSALPALCLLTLSAGLIQPAHAAPVTLTLDNPNQTVAVPVSGSVTLDFTGMFSLAANETFTGSQLDFAFNSSGPPVITSFGPENFFTANNGGSYNGLLFTADVDSTTAPGLYQFEGFTANPSIFSITGTDGTTDTTVAVPFSIQINSAPVPEASTTVSFGLLLALGLGGVVIAARRKKGASQA